MDTVEQLERKLEAPSDALISFMERVHGDVLILGAGGKMGPSLARKAQRAIHLAGVEKRVIAVSRFSSEAARNNLADRGIETIACDLLDDQQLSTLPTVKNVIYMAGQKFGTTGNESLTWAMNTYLPGKIAEKYRASRIVVFSTGNVYPLTAVTNGGATEQHPVNPVGEYAQSCLGRERMFEYYSRKFGTEALMFRLNYAIDLRYGVLLEIARAVHERRSINLSMGSVNVIWQGDANDMALRALEFCSSPPAVLNITGPETSSVRWLAEEFGNLFGVTPIFTNEESNTALLSNAARAHQLFGYPSVTLHQMIDWTAQWVANGGPALNKPTSFQEREGRF